jgi:acetyltransferase-like isoleucine patch superfamily enzyme
LNARWAQADPNAVAADSAPEYVVCVDDLSHRSLGSRVKSRAAATWWRMIGARRYAAVGPGSWVERPLLLHGVDAIRIGANVRVWPLARLEAFGGSRDSPRITIGDDTVIHPLVHIAAARSVQIGRGCLFASQIYITDHDHEWREPGVSAAKSRKLICSPVTIGDDVWLGERVTVLRGVSIGTGAIVGSGAVVVKDIPALCVAAGVPARVLRRWNDASQRWEKCS